MVLRLLRESRLPFLAILRNPKRCSGVWLCAGHTGRIGMAGDASLSSTRGVCRNSYLVAVLVLRRGDARGAGGLSINGTVLTVSHRSTPSPAIRRLSTTYGGVYDINLYSTVAMAHLGSRPFSLRGVEPGGLLIT